MPGSLCQVGDNRQIEAHLAKSEKRWNVYEAANVSAAARLAMLTAFVQGRPVKECVVAALESVGMAEAEASPC